MNLKPVKISAGPPLGSKLGPMGVKLNEVVASAVKIASDYKHLPKIPLTFTIDTVKRSCEVSLGKFSTSLLILNRLKIKKGASTAGSEVVKVINLEELKELSEAVLKEKEVLATETKLNRVSLELRGTLKSMGVKINE